MLLLPSTYWVLWIASITVAIVRIPKLGNQVQSLEPNFIREMKEGVVVLETKQRIVCLITLRNTIYFCLYANQCTISFNKHGTL